MIFFSRTNFMSKGETTTHKKALNRESESHGKYENGEKAHFITILVVSDTETRDSSE